MGTTLLPPQWSEDQAYNYGDKVSYAGIIYKCIQSYTVEHSVTHNPATDINHEWWLPLQIYLKDVSVMDKKNYSGEENFWDKDHFYIDTEGYVYENGENTGINVRGPSGLTNLHFEDLTPAQIELIRGPQGRRGYRGPQGEQGPQGETGAIEFESLTPTQIEQLKGDPGKSTYQIWLDAGHQGTEEDFLDWVRSTKITLDTEPSTTSPNGITNAAITNTFEDYKTYIEEYIDRLEDRVADLENRLQTQNNIQFKFGVTTEGKYGYFISGTNRIVPFVVGDEEILTSNNAELNAPSVFQTQIGIGEGQAAQTNIQSQYTIPSSLEGSISNNTGEDLSLLYSDNVVPVRMNEIYGLKKAVFEDGLFTQLATYGLYSMNYPYVDAVTPVTLSSLNEENIEGIYFPPDSLSHEGNLISIEVEPITAGNTIYYQMGTFNTLDDELPDIIVNETYTTHEDGNFSNTIILTYEVPYDYGFYFASRQRGAYKIKSIYIE